MYLPGTSELFLAWGTISCDLVGSLLRVLDLPMILRIYFTNQKGYYLQWKHLHLSYFTGSELFQEKRVGIHIILLE